MAKITKQALEKLYIQEEMTQSEIAEEMDVTQSYISRKMKEWDIDSRYSDFWTEEDEKLLEKIYLEKDREQLQEEFPNRSWNSIKLKAIEIGVARDQEKYRRSDEVREKLTELAEENKIEVDFDNTGVFSYILGVIEGDGFHDNDGTIGLEVTSEKFANKFVQQLKELGLNPGKGNRRGKISVWASSTDLVTWMMERDRKDKIRWLKEKGSPWKYIEGQYESDGNIHPSGSPRICSYDDEEKKFIKELFDFLGVKTSIQSNNVWVRKQHRDKFFDNIEPVIRKKGSKT